MCLSVPDFSDFSRVVYVRVTDGTEQYRFENRDLKVPEKNCSKTGPDADYRRETNWF